MYNLVSGTQCKNEVLSLHGITFGFLIIAMKGHREMPPKNRLKVAPALLTFFQPWTQEKHDFGNRPKELLRISILKDTE